jgi:vacuolar protein sorting-associated protein 33A
MTTASTSDAQASAQTHNDEAALDVNLLKELGKKALIDALNSVRKYHQLVLSKC